VLSVLEPVVIVSAVATGASFVPATVTTTSCDTAVPSESVAVTLKVSVFVSPTDKLCVVALSML